jgi:hypothetical protein
MGKQTVYNQSDWVGSGSGRSDTRLGGNLRRAMSSRYRTWRAPVVMVATIVCLLLFVPMTATASSVAQETNATEFTATSEGGELAIGGEGGQSFSLASGDVVIDGEIAGDGTWESTDVEFADIEIQGISADVSTPNGLSGEFDPGSDRFTVEGEIVVSAFGQEIRFDISAESEADQTDLDEDGGPAVVADDTFTVGETGTPVDEELGLPATDPGDNRLTLPLDIESAGTAASPELTVTPESIRFEDAAVNETATETLTVENTGGEPFELRRATLTQWPGELSFEESLPLELTPGETQTATLNFSPEQPEIRATTLVFVGDQPSLRDVVSVSSGNVETEVTVDSNQTRVDVSVRDARANERLNISMPAERDSDDEGFRTEGIGVIPNEDADIDMEVTASNEALETTPESTAGLTSNAAQLGNLSIDLSLSDEQTDSVEITTRIDRERLATLDSDPGNVSLYRFNETADRWVAQKTTVIERAEEFVRVRGSADHASEWTAAAARPDFDITRSDVNVDVATVDETVTIDVFVENTGETEGTYIADLLLNGDIVDSKESVIAEGGETLFGFERSFAQPGNYEVQVNEEQIAEIEVTEDETVEAETEDDSSDPAGDAGSDGGTDNSDGTGDGFGVVIAVLAIAFAVGVVGRRE